MTVPERLLPVTVGGLGLPPPSPWPSTGHNPPHKCPAGRPGPAPCPAQRRPGRGVGGKEWAPAPPNANPPRGTTRCPPRQAAPRAGPGRGLPPPRGLPGGWKPIRQAAPRGSHSPCPGTGRKGRRKGLWERGALPGCRWGPTAPAQGGAQSGGGAHAREPQA